MEEIIQRVFSILVSVIIFFLLPMYIAFEKKDDISYSLSLQITQDFVNKVASKGYLTRGMYDDFVSNLSMTDNTYTISLEHISKKYYPIYNNYENDGKYKESFDYAQFNKEKDIKNFPNIKLGYSMKEEKYYTDQILAAMDSSETILTNTHYKTTSIDELSLRPNLYATGIYTMNEGDQFNVIVKNDNTTIASILFNTLTFGANNDNPKVYIDYGATIDNADYLKESFKTSNPAAAASSSSI